MQFFSRQSLLYHFPGRPSLAGLRRSSSVMTANNSHHSSGLSHHRHLPWRCFFQTHASAMSPKTFKINNPPNPSWTFGQKVNESPIGREWVEEGDESGWKTVDTSKEDPRDLYRLLTSGIVPRPVAFVSSVSEDGVGNLAPFSWFNQVSAFPPVISVACTRSAALTRVHDTVRNILATKDFTVNIISEPWVAQANVTSVDAPEEYSEWPVSGLTKEPSIHVSAPRVKESAFSMECDLLETVDIVEPNINEVTTTLILGSVKYIHVRKDMLNERGGVDPGKFQPVARMGGTLFARLTEGYHIARHSWKRHEQEVRAASESKD